MHGRLVPTKYHTVPTVLLVSTVLELLFVTVVITCPGLSLSTVYRSLITLFRLEGNLIDDETVLFELVGKTSLDVADVAIRWR